MTAAPLTLDLYGDDLPELGGAAPSPGTAVDAHQAVGVHRAISSPPAATRSC